MGPTQKLLAVAAAETLERIRRDQERVSLQLRPLLAYLEQHLFEPGLDANQLKRACGVRDNSLSVHFRNALDLPPYGYIEDCRFQVACRLLRDTEVEIWRIAQMLGYSTLQVFSRAFQRWSGMRPSRYRDQEREMAASASDDEAAAEETPKYPLIRLETLRRAVNGGLEGDEAEALFARLAKLYPAKVIASAPQPIGTPGAPLTVEQQQALDAWEEIRKLSRDKQRQAVRHRLRFTTPAFVELLWAKSREEGRDNRRHGVGIAELALESLEGIAPDALSDERRASLKALCWAWICNARRLATDLVGAEQALKAAEAEIPDSDLESTVEAELLEIKAGLRSYQRRFDESLTCLNRSIALYRSCRESDLLARALIGRAINHRLAGNPAAGIPDLREAVGLIDRSEDLYQKYSAYFDLASCYTTAGQIWEAKEFLPFARNYADKTGIQDGPIRIRWLEGNLAWQAGDLEAAEQAFREVRSEYLGLEDESQAASASLDLAAVLAVQGGRSAEVLALTAEIIPFFEAIEVRQEAIAALQLLRRALEANHVPVSVLHQARAALRPPEERY